MINFLSLFSLLNYQSRKVFDLFFETHKGMVLMMVVVMVMMMTIMMKMLREAEFGLICTLIF